MRKEKQPPFVAIIIRSETDLTSKTFTCIKKARDYAKRLTGVFVMADIKGNPIFRSGQVARDGVKINATRVFNEAPSVENLASEPYTRHVFQGIVELKRERRKEAKKAKRRKSANTWLSKQKRIYKAPGPCKTIGVVVK